MSAFDVAFMAQLIEDHVTAENVRRGVEYKSGAIDALKAEARNLAEYLHDHGAHGCAPVEPIPEAADAIAERYVSAFMGEHASATVYRERLVEMVANVAVEAARAVR